MLLSIRNKFLIIFIALSIFSISLLTYVYTAASSRILQQLTTTTSLEITELHANNIGQTLKRHISGLQFVANQLGARNKDMSYISENIIELRQSENFNFEETFFVWPSGNIYAPGYDTFTAPNEAYYQSITKIQDSYHISNPVEGIDGSSAVFAISVPIWSMHDQLVGYISGTISLEGISQKLVHVKHSKDSFGWIINKDGYIITHPNFDIESYVNIYELDLYGYQEIGQFVDSLMNNDEGIGEYYDNSNGHVHRIVTYKTIPHSPGWKLGITTNKEDIFAYIMRLRNRLITMSFVVIIITLFITTIMTNNIVKPIQKLTTAASQGNPLENRVNRIQANKEINDLINAYNRMSESIRKHTEELELLVNERTTELKKANKELFVLASQDKLTGVLNRGHLYKELDKLKAAVDAGEASCFSLLFIDLNNFKYYNDNFGHDVGDRILVHIVGFLKEHIEDPKIIARYGGDEFVIALPDVNEVDLLIIVKKLDDKVKALNGYQDILKDWLNREIAPIPENKKFGISTGYTYYTRVSPHTIDSLIKEADEHMYQVKQAIKANYSK